MVKEEDYSVFNKEILGGLKAAIERGDSLKNAMMAFYQAGYDKEEIEISARELLDEQKNRTEQPIQKTPEKNEKISVLSDKNKNAEQKTNTESKKPEPKNTGSKPIFSSKKPAEDMDNSVMQKKKKGFSLFSKNKKDKNEQKVSSYDTVKKPKGPKNKTLTIVLVIILVLLLGVLLTVFVYKGSFVNFFNSLLNKGS